MLVPILLVVLGSTTLTNGQTFPFQNTSLPIPTRVADLVSRLTMEEKLLQMTRGGAAKNNPAPAIPRLNISAHVWGTECNSGLGTLLR